MSERIAFVLRFIWCFECVVCKFIEGKIRENDQRTMGATPVGQINQTLYWTHSKQVSWKIHFCCMCNVAIKATILFPTSLRNILCSLCRLLWAHIHPITWPYSSSSNSSSSVLPVLRCFFFFSHKRVCVCLYCRPVCVCVCVCVTCCSLWLLPQC